MTASSMPPLAGPAPRVDRGCAEPGCDGAHVARGLCRRHYSRHWYAATAERRRDYARSYRARRKEAYGRQEGRP